jgi:hypothetical protein
MSLPPKKTPLEAFDILQKHKEFHTPILNPHTPKAKVQKYIPLVYDKNSPLHDAYQDLMRVKIVAAELSGFVKEAGGKFHEQVEMMFRCEQEIITTMIVRYITLNKSALFEKYSRTAAAFLLGDAKMSEFDNISKALELCETELLAHDNKLQEDFTQYYFESKLELRPEDIAERLKKGEPPVDVQEGTI